MQENQKKKFSEQIGVNMSFDVIAAVQKNNICWVVFDIAAGYTFKM
jgi:hypothetical protein